MSILTRLKTTAKVLINGLDCRKCAAYRISYTQTVSRYDHLIQLFRNHNPTTMIEIGVWRGDRGEHVSASTKMIFSKHSKVFAL